MMLDATKQDVQRELLERELESVGIRLNKQKPNIYFKVSKLVQFVISAKSLLRCIIATNY